MSDQLAGWQNFYVIVGSSAGALIGLQFVVIALISSNRTQVQRTALRAYASPTIVYFATVVLLAGTMTIPHHATASLGALLTLYGAIGVGYVAWVFSHLRIGHGYTPDAGDWTWFVVLPAAAYASVFVSGVLVWSVPRTALDLTAASALALLFVGVHNAWDSAVWMVANP